MRDVVLTKVLTVANPPAGQGTQIVVPTGENWKVRTARFVLVTSAGVGNRQPYLTVRHRDDGGAAPYIAGSPFNVPASTTQILSFAAGGVNYQAAFTTLAHIYLPELWLPAGSMVQFQVQGIQAADQLSGVLVAVERG